jgi:hypothetical protein
MDRDSPVARGELNKLSSCFFGIISIVRGKKPGFSEKPGFWPFKPQVIERILFLYPFSLLSKSSKPPSRWRLGAENCFLTWAALGTRAESSLLTRLN